MMLHLNRCCCFASKRLVETAAVVVLVPLLLHIDLCSASITYGRQICVYGATPAGIAASLSAAKRGSLVTLLQLSHDTLLGGMTSSGLGWDDVANPMGEYPRPASIFGNSSYTRFADAIASHYKDISPRAYALSMNGTRHEPHVSEAVFRRLLGMANVSIFLIDELVSTTINEQGRITAINVRVTPGGPPMKLQFHVYIDASYEGDLLALSGVPFRVGREGRSEFGEINAGIVFTDNVKKSFLRGSTGSASPLVPAMSWRLCFSNLSANSVSLDSPPEDYNRSLYLGYVADVAAGRIPSVWSAWSGPRALPPDGTKFDINCNPRPLGFIWNRAEKETYIHSNRTYRTKILTKLKNLALGLLYFQQNDVAVSAEDRAHAKTFGLCADEFNQTQNFPPQLYIREARRIQSIRRFSERDLIPEDPNGRPPIKPDACAVGSFAIDAFPASSRLPATDQQGPSTAQEGYISMEDQMVSPNTLPIGMMIPPNISNLVIPVAVGATHVAFSSVRLEPTWMLVGGAAGIIAAMTSSKVSVSEVPLLAVQQAIGDEQPLVLYTDLEPGDDHYTAMNVLGPHGIAASDNFRAAPKQPIIRAMAASWLVGAMLALNSTVGSLAKLPNISASKQWKDFGPADTGFYAAVVCASWHIFDPPSPTTMFYPSAILNISTWKTWVGKLPFGSVFRDAHTGFEGHAGALDRGTAADYLYQHMPTEIKA